MLYFSELYGEKVFTESRKYLGRVRDFYFLPAETARITKVALQAARRQSTLLEVPLSYFRKNGIGFIVKDDYEISTKTAEEMSLFSTLQNQQIIDINGEKVIRVNDVIINTLPEYTISGIDIGIIGVFRWIGAANLFADLLRRFGLTYKSSYIPWSELQASEIAKNRIVLKKEQEKLHKILPEDLAEHLEKASIHNIIKTLRVMDKDISAQVIADLNLDYQKEIIGRYSSEHAAQLLALIDADEIVDVLLVLEKSKQQEILKWLPAEKRRQVEHLLQHAKTPIGHLLSTNYLAVAADSTIRSALTKIHREGGNFSELLYVYVFNQKNQVVGVFNLQELLIQKPDRPVYKSMNQNLVLGRLTTPVEIVLSRLLKYHLYAMPIVDDNRQLLGIVSLQDIAENILAKEK